VKKPTGSTATGSTTTGVVPDVQRSAVIRTARNADPAASPTAWCHDAFQMFIAEPPRAAANVWQNVLTQRVNASDQNAAVMNGVVNMVVLAS
jgi:hypothetical protein